MQIEYVEGAWLTQHDAMSLTELAERSGLSESDLRELVDFGAVAPMNSETQPWLFDGRCLPTVRTARRLRVSFDLELDGVALMISLLDRIRELEDQVTGLRASLPRSDDSYRPG